MPGYEFRRGFQSNLAVAFSVAAYGSVLGVLAAQKGISWHALLVMNLSIFAGSAQFVMVDMWLPPLPILEITLAVFVINLRYLFIGASLQPLFRGKSLIHRMAMMHLVADENWAVTMSAWRRGQRCAPSSSWTCRSPTSRAAPTPTLNGRRQCDYSHSTLGSRV